MAEKIQQYAKEYKFAINDISRDGVKLRNPYGEEMEFTYFLIFLLIHFLFRSSKNLFVDSEVEHLERRCFGRSADQERIYSVFENLLARRNESVTETILTFSTTNGFGAFG